MALRKVLSDTGLNGYANNNPSFGALFVTQIVECKWNELSSEIKEKNLKYLCALSEKCLGYQLRDEAIFTR